MRPDAQLGKLRVHWNAIHIYRINQREFWKDSKIKRHVQVISHQTELECLTLLNFQYASCLSIRQSKNLIT